MFFYLCFSEFDVFVTRIFEVKKCFISRLPKRIGCNETINLIRKTKSRRYYLKILLFRIEGL